MHIYVNIINIILEMTTVSEERYRENQNTQFMNNKLFPKIVSFMRAQMTI